MCVYISTGLLVFVTDNIMAHHWATFTILVIAVTITCLARPQQQQHQQQQQQYQPQTLYYGDTSPQRFQYYQQQSQEQPAPLDAAYLPNLNKAPSRTNGASLLGVAYSPASEVSQLTFQGSFANFSY